MFTLLGIDDETYVEPEGSFLCRGGEMSEKDVARLQEQIKTLFNDVDELKTDVKEIKQQLANRLPLWATVLISVLTGTIGWLIR